jgi:hypothetical protein
MSSNPEQRDKTRFPHETPITLENLEIGLLHGARMLNFSAEGMYFESDYLFQPRTELYIGVTNSPYADDADVYECYRAEIRWRKSLKKSSYYYGYGVRYLELKPVETHPSEASDLRKHPRRPCDIPVKYITKHDIYQGEAKNISLGGIFLKTENEVEIGQQLNLAIPVRKKGKIIKRTGKIVWSNQTGVGIKFLSQDKK